MLEHIRHYVGQILLCHQLLLIAQLDDAVGYAPCLLGSEFQTEFLEILEDIGLAAVFAQGVFALAAESLRQQFVAIERILLIAVGMHASHLGKHALANDWLVGWHGDARIILHEAADFIEFRLVDACFGAEMVLENRLHAR